MWISFLLSCLASIPHLKGTIEYIGYRSDIENLGNGCEGNSIFVTEMIFNNKKIHYVLLDDKYFVNFKII